MREGRHSALLLLLAGACTACGGQTTSDTADPGDLISGCTCCDDPVHNCNEIPAPPDVPPNGTAAPELVAISHLYVGDTDRDGNASTSAWKDYGYNLDGLISSKTDVNHCKLVTGASAAKVKSDGNRGIDNSFGANLLVILTTLDPQYSATANQQIINGEYTLLQRRANLLDASTDPDQTGITGTLLRGVDRQAPDTWPTFPGYELAFPDAYVAGGTWVSGMAHDVTLPLPMFGLIVDVPMSRAVVTLEPDGAGTIAGVIDTEAFVEKLESVATLISASFCGFSPFAVIAQPIRQASDIMLDGTNGDASQTCNGISIGLGFDGAPAELGGVAPPPPPPPDPCALPPPDAG